MQICMGCRRTVDVAEDAPLDRALLDAFCAQKSDIGVLAGSADFARRQQIVLKQVQRAYTQDVADVLSRPRSGSTATTIAANALREAQHAALASLFSMATDKAQSNFPACATCSDKLCQQIQEKIKIIHRECQVYTEALEKKAWLNSRKTSVMKLERKRHDEHLDLAAEDAVARGEELNETMSKAMVTLLRTGHSDPDAAPQTAGPHSSRSNSSDRCSEGGGSDGLEARLLDIQQMKSVIACARKGMREKAAVLAKLERRALSLMLAHALRVLCMQRAASGVQRSLDITAERYRQLKRTNVLDDAFHISYNGHFGTINGFRLGRLTSVPVEWNELNAAFGQCTLLLETLATTCGYRFRTFQPVPRGSFSKMRKLNEKPPAEYELFGSSDLRLGRLFWWRSFDTGLQCLLGAVHELGKFAERMDRRFTQRYVIRNDSIGGVSVCLQFSSDEKWTMALKLLLTNLKLLLVWAANGARGRGDGQEEEEEEGE